MKQLTHHEVKNNNSLKELIVVAENIRTPENVGMLFRIAEAFGVKKILLVGESPNLSNNKVLRTARSTVKQLDIQLFENSKEIIKQLKAENYLLLGLELTDTSKSLKNLDLSNKTKIALFVGSERFGIEEETLTQLDIITHINLYGKNSSINVVTALGIALFKINK